MGSPNKIGSKGKTIFESSSSDEDFHSSYTSRSKSQIHRTNSVESSSSDLDVAQLDDFRPLLAKKRNTNKMKKSHIIDRSKETKIKSIHQFRGEIDSLKATNNGRHVDTQNGNVL